MYWSIAKGAKSWKNKQTNKYIEHKLENKSSNDNFE